MKKEYKGSCHCGAIRFTFSAPEMVRVLRCNCSICRRKGATMTEFTVGPEEIEIKVKADCLATYQFGSKVAKHHFCNKCGIYPFHRPASNPDHYCINVGCIENLDYLSLPSKVFDAASL